MLSIIRRPTVLKKYICEYNHRFLFVGDINKVPIMSKFYSQKSEKDDLPENGVKTSMPPGKSQQIMHTPNTLEKYLLVWMKKYPSVAEVPDTVTSNKMDNVRNWARIKISTILCIVTAIGFILMARSGKKAAKQGESVHKMNVDWHKSQNEKK